MVPRVTGESGLHCSRFTVLLIQAFSPFFVQEESRFQAPPAPAEQLVTSVRVVRVNEVSQILITREIISEMLSRAPWAGAPHAKQALLSEMSSEKVN